MIFNNLIFIIVLIVLCIFINKYFSIILKKYNPKLLIDNQFNKPQAFHEKPTSISGGFGIFFSFLIIHSYLLIFQNVIYYEYLSFCTLFFLLGFVDDLKVKIKPNTRLLIMFIFLILLIQQNNLYIENTGIEFLNNWLLSSKIFSLFFMCLCFLFIINGANLIDGYNGLLGIHSLIIITNLFFINFFNENNLALLLFCAILILIIFLKFNFPKAALFLGDGGSYILGTFIAISVIKTSIDNPEISPFYFAILLCYLFFEVFFSFIRKLSTKGGNPLLPDKKHLHMLLYQILYKKNKQKNRSNYTTSIIINVSYLLLTLPAIYFFKSNIFCKYYLLTLILVYIFSYKITHEKSY